MGEILRGDRLDIQQVPETSSDEPVHVLDYTCWCQPYVGYHDPVTGGRVIVHRRTIDSPREDDEAGA